MQLQKSVSALQVDGSKSHTIFSILWSISLALCWYSWSIASSDPWKCMCNSYFPEPCQQFQRILMSVKDNNNFLCVLIHYCIVVPGFLPTFSFPVSMCSLNLEMPMAHNLPWKFVVWLGCCQRLCWCHAFWILSFPSVT